jgi:trigger factor
MATDVHDHDHDHDHGDEEHEHHHETKAVTLSLTIKEIKRRELPEVDDAFAKEVGQETVLAMRVKVRQRLEEVHAKAAEKDVENKMLDILVDRSSFEMAKGPVDRALAARVDRVVLERMLRGESEESARAAVEGDRQKIRDVVERDAKAWLIVEKLAKKEKIFALEDDVAKEIARIAEEQGTTPTKVREHYESQEMMPELRANVLERKVLDFLRSHGTITEGREDGAAAAKARAEAGEVEGT